MVMSSNTARTLITNALKAACTAKHGAVRIRAWREAGPNDWLWELASKSVPEGYDDESVEIDHEWLAAFDRELTGSWTFTFTW